MNLSPRRRNFLIALPLILSPSTALVFTSLSGLMGQAWGYLLGFLFYWLFWCLLVPFLFLGQPARGELIMTRLGVSMQINMS